MEKKRKINRIYKKTCISVFFTYLCVVVLFAVAILYTTSQSTLIVERNTKELAQSQISRIANRLQESYSGFQSLCKILSQNKPLQECAQLQGNEKRYLESITELQEELKNYSSVFGEGLREIAVYFPGIRTIVSVDNGYTDDQCQWFFQKSGLTEKGLYANASNVEWGLHFGTGSNWHNWMIRKLEKNKEPVAFIMVDYSLVQFLSELKEMNGVVWIGNDTQCIYGGSGEVENDAVYQQILDSAGKQQKLNYNGREYFTMSSKLSFVDLNLISGIRMDNYQASRNLQYSVTIPVFLLEILCVLLLIQYLRKEVFSPIYMLIETTYDEDMKGGIGSLLSKASERITEIQGENQAVRREQEKYFPTVLGRMLLRLMQSEPGKNLDLAIQCLSLAGLETDSVELLGITCLADSEGLLSNAENDVRSDKSVSLSYFFLENILKDLLLCNRKAVIAVLGDFYLVIAEKGPDDVMNSIRQQLPEIYRSVLKASIVTTEVIEVTAPEQMQDALVLVTGELNFYRFWKKEKMEEKENDEEEFPFFEQLRTLMNRLSAKDYTSSKDILQNLLKYGLPKGRSNLNEAKFRVLGIAGAISATLENCPEGAKIKEQLSLNDSIYEANDLEAFQNATTRIMDALIACEQEKNNTSSPKKIEEIKQYIDHNYTQNGLNVSSVADAFGISDSYLSRAFKSLTGVNVLEYIQKLRVNKAKQLLQNDEETIKAVAEKVGFLDTQSFVRTFKKYEGLSPSEYKKIHADMRKDGA